MLTMLGLSAALLALPRSLFASAPCFSFTVAPTASATPPQPENNKRVQDVKFFSKALQREMQYRVILPKDYFTTEIVIPSLSAAWTHRALPQL